MSAANPIRLVLAGNNAIVLACLDQLFAREKDFEVVGRCGKGEDALPVVEELGPDILLLDLAPAPWSGLELLRAIRKRKLAARVIFLSGTLQEAEFLEAVSLGVRAMVPRDIHPGVLAQCIRRVHAGGIWLGQRTAVPARTDDRDPAPGGESESLTPREKEIVRLVCAGLRNRQIAERLGIGEGTIKTHLHQIYEKLHLRDRLQLGLYCREKNLI